jgi:hypothetical protein
MKREYWIKGFILLLLGFGSLLSNACGGGWDYRGFTLFFNPFEKDQPQYNYLYNPYTYTYDLDYNFNPPNQSEFIINEWATFLGTRDKKEVVRLIFENNLADINALAQAQEKNVAFGKVKLVSKNALYRNVYTQPYVLQYIQLIQDYSYRVNSFTDEWEYAYHAQQADPYKLQANQQKAEALFAKIKTSENRISNFIKPRLAYHLVRSAYFNRQFELAEKYLGNYAQAYNSSASSIVYDWLEGMRGGVALHAGKTNQAILHYAREFNQSKSAHYQAYIDLKWLSNDHNLLDALTQAKNKQDSLNIYAAAAATNSKLSSEAFNKIIRNIADEEIRFFLWFRELQKVEETYFHPKICNSSFSRWDDYGEYLKEHSELIANNYKAFRGLTLSLYNMCSNVTYKSHYANGLAYINLMDGNYETELPQKEKASTSIAKYQRTVFSLYQQVRANQELDDDEVINLLEMWKKDFFKLSENNQTLNYFIRDFVAPHYLYHQKDTLNALFLWSVSDGRYYWDEKPNKNIISLSSSDVSDVLMNYTLSTNQYLELQNRLRYYDTPLLAWARSKGIKVSMGDSKKNDLLFYKYVRDENWKMAEKELYKSDLSYKSRKYYDPFLMHYDGYLSPTALDSTQPMMSAKAFLRLGAKLKSEVQQNPTAENQLRYGQYLLSTTFHGHNSIADDADLGYLSSTYYHFKPWFYEVKKFGTYVGYYYFYESFQFEPSKREMDYYHCYKAESYFKKGYSQLSDKEERAKCCFLLAKCVQKRTPIPPMAMNEYGYLDAQEIEYKGTKYESYIYHSFTNPYLLEMDRLYADTKTYEQAKSECSYLRYILK